MIFSPGRCALAVAVVVGWCAGSQSAWGASVLIDDFESYTTGGFNGATDADAVWTARDGGSDVPSTSLVQIQDDGSTQHLAFGWNTGQRGAYREVTSIDEGASGTYYFQVRTRDETPDTSYGLSAEPSPTAAGFGDFEAQVALVDDGDGGNGVFDLIARNGGVFDVLQSGLTADTWYDVWIVADNDTDTYDVLFGTTGDADALGTVVGSELAFRNGTTDPLGTFMTLSNNHDDAQADLDNIYHNPVAVPEPGAILLAVAGMAWAACCRQRRWGG